MRHGLRHDDPRRCPEFARELVFVRTGNYRRFEAHQPDCPSMNQG